MSRIAIAIETGMVVMEISVPRPLPRNSRTTRPQSRTAAKKLFAGVVEQILTKWALS